MALPVYDKITEILVVGDGIYLRLIDLIAAAQFTENVKGVVELCVVFTACNKVCDLLRCLNGMEWTNMEFIIQCIP